MSRTDAVYHKNALFINAALLATHANSSDGFRQKDVKFYIELLTNWMETSFRGFGLDIQNTQVQRILKDLSAEGILKEELVNKRPRYHFTSVGLLEITTRLVSDDSLMDLHNFYFLYHVVSLYSGKMEELLVRQRDSLPKSYKIEIKHLLNPANLIDRQIQRVNKEIDKLESRIKDAYKMSEIAEGMIKKEKPLSEIVLKIESLYPYQLNNQKKMSELFNTLSSDVQYLEITEAPKLRAKTLWEPLLKDYQSYLSNIQQL
ncbi:MAG: hypothetical protein GY909_00670 [Oligoflexia bacterium]|nr:hypothetical protein [Oligoflexia bacterium]